MLKNSTEIPAGFFASGGGLSFRAYAFLFLLCAAFFIPGIATLPPTDRDESSFAQATKQMIETGNYVDIRLQDKPRYKKPIGIYWLQAASVKLLDAGHLNEIWAYRIPSFAGATLAVLMTAALGSLLFGPMAGLLAAIMMTGCVILNVEARLAKTDAALLGSIMVAQYALARAYMNRNAGCKNGFVFWTALGAGIMIKGPIILLVLLSTLLWLRLSDKNLGWFPRLKPLAGIPWLLLIVAPWFIAILMQSHGAFLQQSAGQDMMAKLWQGQNRGILPPGLHLVAFPILFFPFSLMALLAVPSSWRNRADPAVKFCLGWIVPTWIVFELSLTKLPHYVMPAYPAIAMLTAKMLTDYFTISEERSARWLMTIAVALWLTIGTGFAVVFGLLPFFTDHVWNYGQLAAGLFLVIAQAASLLFFLQGKTASVTVLSAGSLIFMATVFGSTLPGLQHMWVSRQIAQVATIIKPCDAPQIISAAYGEPSLVFMMGTDTRIVPGGTEAAEAMQKNPCAIGVIDAKRRQEFLDAFADKKPQPVAMGTAEGLNIGHGKKTEMTLFIMPPQAKMP